MWLPAKEYGELCHAITTRFANKIPAVGNILYKDHYYAYTYDEFTHKIDCIEQIEIVGNEEYIAVAMRGFKNE